MDLSVIIPAFNASSYIESKLRSLHKFLQERYGEFEIVLVDDGSSDDTRRRAEDLGLEGLICISQEQNKGKYAALKLGIKTSRGRCKVFTDADLPYDLEAIPYIESLISRNGFHVVIGDRSLVNSSFEKQTKWPRRITHRVLRTFIRLLFVSQIYDSQCGLKGFRADVADELFPLLREEGFAGDIELLYLALKFNLDIKRIPVRLGQTSSSTVRVIHTGLNILKRALLLTPLWHLGYYSSEKLRALGNFQYWSEGPKSDAHLG